MQIIELRILFETCGSERKPKKKKDPFIVNMVKRKYIHSRLQKVYKLNYFYGWYGLMFNVKFLFTLFTRKNLTINW